MGELFSFILFIGCVCSILGTPFYLMEYVHGRIFKDPTLPGLERSERLQIYNAMCDVLTRIHKVNIQQAGLEDFGRSGQIVINI